MFYLLLLTALTNILLFIKNKKKSFHKASKAVWNLLKVWDMKIRPNWMTYSGKGLYFFFLGSVLRSKQWELVHHEEYGNWTVHHPHWILHICTCNSGEALVNNSDIWSAFGGSYTVPNHRLFTHPPYSFVCRSSVCLLWSVWCPISSCRCFSSPLCCLLTSAAWRWEPPTKNILENIFYNSMWYNH